VREGGKRWRKYGRRMTEEGDDLPIHTHPHGREGGGRKAEDGMYIKQNESSYV